MTHWKKLKNPDYLGAYAFEPKEEKTVTIDHVSVEKVIGQEGKSSMCTVAYFMEADVKPLILNATNSKAISKLYNTPYIEEWHGKRITLKVQQVKAFGDIEDAVRVSPEIPRKILCVDCGNEVQPYGARTAQEIADYTRGKYGRILCSKCAEKAAESK